MTKNINLIKRITLGLVPVLMTGCVQLLDWSGKVMLRGDIRDLFERFEVSSDDIRCYPVAEYRMGFCTSTLSSEEVDRLVVGLALESEDFYSDPNELQDPDELRDRVRQRIERGKSLESENVDGDVNSLEDRSTAMRPMKIDSLRNAIRDLERGCRSLTPFEKGTSVEAYGAYGQDASIRELELNSAGIFDSFFLLYNVETGEACLQASYAYGI
ncbi:hypothetical protein [Baaleninema simplex]|uniref:hypothetical protein n=1 Tax=Baaleninema simplex TaxID=2862350 RepID=UPI00035F41DA|nr:hypothetical protein [Baaleninema simplex]